MNNQPTRQVACGPVVARLSDAMAHIPIYASCYGARRLSKDAGISERTLFRLLKGELNPSYLTVCRVVAAVEAHLGRHVDPRDVFAENGAFLARHTCGVVGCNGCLPDAAYTPSGDRAPAFLGVEPGQWVTSRYPKGYEPLGRAA